MSNIVLSTFAIGMSAAFLWNFYNITRYGRHVVQEPNILILILELILFCSIFVFSCYMFVKYLKE